MEALLETAEPAVVAVRVEGRIASLVVRTALHGEARAIPSAVALAGHGLMGDHGTVDPAQIDGPRQITLMQAEHLPVIAALLGREAASVRPADLRRNVVVSGLNLLSVLHRRPHARPLLRFGHEVLVEITDPCEPCGWLERTVGRGAVAASRGHGGVCGRILAGGILRVSDPVTEVGRR